MRYVAALAALVVLAACGSETEPGSRAEESPTPAAPVVTPTSMPTAVPVPDGPVKSSVVNVLDDGDGAELCLGGQLDSYPPQCGGPRLVGWDWSQHEGDYEEASGVRWGDFGVTGTFDGRDFTPTEVVPADELEPAVYEDTTDFASPCPEPEGGWAVIDPTTTSMRSQDATMRAARRIEGYAGAWLDQTINPAYGSDDGEEQMAKLNDPALLVINVQVTGDPAAAEAVLRETWGGALCVTRAQHTERELRAIQREVLELPGMLGGGSGFDKVDAFVIFDDGTLQAWVDREYGPGVVEIGSALVPVD